jgi:hypothetical protein
MYLLLFLAPFYACNREMEPCLFNHYNHALFNRGLAVTGKYFQLDQPLSCSGKEVGTLSLWSVGAYGFYKFFFRQMVSKTFTIFMLSRMATTQSALGTIPGHICLTKILSTLHRVAPQAPAYEIGKADSGRCYATVRPM